MDSTKYFIEISGEPKGPYTFNQLTELWKNGAVTAEGQFWTEADGCWRPLLQLKLDATDAKEMNMRVVRVYSPRSEEISGPFSFLDLQYQMEAGKITPEEKFWWPCSTHWFDFQVLQMALEERISGTDSGLMSSVYDASQMTPPPVTKQWTVGKQLFANVGTLIGAAFVLIVIIAVLAFMMMG